MDLGKNEGFSHTIHIHWSEESQTGILMTRLKLAGNRAVRILIISYNSQFVPILVFRTLDVFQFGQAVLTLLALAAILFIGADLF